MSRIVTKKLDAFSKKLDNKIKSLSDDQIHAVRRILNRIVATAQTRYLTGGHPINVRTGRLRSSVRVGPIKRQGKKIVGSVGTNVFYGRVLEFGAQTPGHVVKPVNIDPRTGKVFTHLRFRLGPYGAHGEAKGRWVSVKSVKMSPKPWLSPAVRDNRSFIMEELAAAGMINRKRR